jgi:hypothetical protein
VHCQCTHTFSLSLPHFHWYPHGIYPLQGKGIRTDIEITYELSTQVKKLTYVNNSPYVFVVNVNDISSNTSVRQRSVWVDPELPQRNIITSWHFYTADQACDLFLSRVPPWLPSLHYPNSPNYFPLSVPGFELGSFSVLRKFVHKPPDGDY